MRQFIAALPSNSGTPTGKTSPGTGLLFIYVLDLIKFVSTALEIKAIYILHGFL